MDKFCFHLNIHSSKMKVHIFWPFFCLFLMIPVRCFFNDSTTCPSFFIFWTKGWWSMFAEVGRNRKFFIMHFSMKLWNLRDLKEMSQRDKKASSGLLYFLPPSHRALCRSYFWRELPPVISVFSIVTYLTAWQYTLYYRWARVNGI